MQHNVNPLLAKLLAKENITIQHGNFKTAWFDLDNRVLGLPDWSDMGKHVYDLLVGHEVSHALNTPPIGFHHNDEKTRGCPKSYLNVIEDARIEKFIQRDYPGLVRSFSLGYDKLLKDGVFGEIDLDNVDEMQLIDRINLKAKLGSRIDIHFNDEEQILFNRTMSSETWDEVVQIVRDILELKKQEEEKEKDDKEELNQGKPNLEDTQDSGEEQSNDTTSNDTTSNDTDSNDTDSNDADSNDTDSNDIIEEHEYCDGTEQDSNNFNYDDSEEERAITDENFRSNEANFVESSEGSQILLIPDITKSDLDNIVVNYDMIKASRLKSLEDPNIDSAEALRYRKVMDDFASIKIKAAKKEAIAAVREFELKKSARQYEKSKTSPLGTIDVNKLHSYMFDDDIFSTTTVLQNSKNHGMVMLLDMSVSMQDSLADVIDQTLFLVMFCQKTNIPFDLYTFTSPSLSWRAQLEKRTLPDHVKIDFERAVTLVKVLSSSMKKVDFNESLTYLSCYPVLHRSTRDKNRYDDHEIHNLCYNSHLMYCAEESMGSTPLNESLIAMRPILTEFKKKHNIEKLSFITLCDGDSQNSITQRSSESSSNSENIIDNIDGYRANILYGKEKIKCRARITTASGSLPYAVINDRNLTQKLIESLKRHVDCNVLGFFVSDSSASFKYRVVNAAATISDSVWENIDEYRKKVNKEYRKNKCVSIKGAYGYSDYFITKGSNLNNDDDFLLEGNESTSQIKSKFKKASCSKKVYKVLLNKFAASVA